MRVGWLVCLAVTSACAQSPTASPPADAAPPTSSPSASPLPSASVAVAVTVSPTAVPATSSVSPIRDANATQVWMGDRQTCARKSGKTSCWGYNASGSLLLPLASNERCLVMEGCRLKPQPVPALNALRALSLAEEASCGIDDKGKTSCWGAVGFLGAAGPAPEPCGTGGMNKCWLTPRPVEMPPAVEVASSGKAVCVRTESGEVWCAGKANDGILGGGQAMECGFRPEECLQGPARVAGITGAKQLVMGGGHACALLGDGTVRCWGSSELGELGDGTTGTPCSKEPLETRCRWAPATVKGIDDAVSINAGLAYTCAVRRGGTVACWGANQHAQLGSAVATPSSCGTQGCSLAPVAVEGLTDVAEVSPGMWTTCARKNDGSVWCWGLAFTTGPNGPSSPVPAQVQGVEGARALDLSVGAACVVTATGLSCWGSNATGQLGDGTVQDRTTPGVVTF